MARTPPHASGSLTSGWAVGNEAFLDATASKVARYWRVIEHGSAATKWPWEGQRVVGLWGPNAGPRGGLINGSPLDYFSGRNDQKFVPFFKSRDGDLLRAAHAALYYFFQGGRGPNMDLIHARPRGNESAEHARRRFYFWLMRYASLEQMPFVTSFIVKAVAPGEYYARTATEKDWPEIEAAAIMRIFANLFTKTTGAGERVALTGAAAHREARENIAYQAFDAKGRTVTARKGASLRPGAAPTLAFNGSDGTPGLFSFQVNPTVFDYSRDVLGHFTSAQTEIIKLNREMAQQFAEAVAQRIQRTQHRPSTDNLVKATRDPRNRSPH